MLSWSLYFGSLSLTCLTSTCSSLNLFLSFSLFLLSQTCSPIQSTSSPLTTTTWLWHSTNFQTTLLSQMLSNYSALTLFLNDLLHKLSLLKIMAKLWFFLFGNFSFQVIRFSIFCAQNGTNPNSGSPLHVPQSLLPSLVHFSHFHQNYSANEIAITITDVD